MKSKAYLSVSVCDFCIKPVDLIDLKYDLCWLGGSKREMWLQSVDPKQAGWLQVKPNNCTSMYTNWMTHTTVWY